MTKKMYQNTKPRRWMIPDRFRQGSSTGARISTKRPGFTSPKGGFYDAGYETAKSIGRYFGYDPEKYISDRLTGTKPENLQWRSKYLYGRETYDYRYATPQFPRYEAKYATYRYPKFQKGNKSRTRKQNRNYNSRFQYNGRGRQCYCRSNWPYRCKCSNWKRNRFR